MIRRIVKSIAWTAGGIAGLVLCFYLALLVINWRDEPPSAVALQMQAFLDSRAPVPDDQNGYVLVMGFAAGQQEDPRAVGQRRIQWLQKWAEGDREGAGPDPLAKPVDPKVDRPAQVGEILQQCSRTAKDCMAIVAADEAVLRDWLDSTGWLLERYQALLRHEAWLETAPFAADMPIPAYATVREGQNLLLAKASLLARDRDATAVRELLSLDVRFWRRVLADADLLITKMIAVSSLNRSFEGGNLVLRQLPAAMALQGMPGEWAMPLSARELSLRRVLAAEWNVSRQTLDDVEQAWSWSAERGIAENLRELAGAPLFQRQAYINNHASMMQRFGDALEDVPLDELREAMAALVAESSRGTRERRFPFSLYNPVGEVLYAIAVPAYVQYVGRVADVEGTRRAALLANTLRGEGVPQEEMVDRLLLSTVREPYSEAAFEWDEAAGAIAFNGLEKPPRGRHSLIF